MLNPILKRAQHGKKFSEGDLVELHHRFMVVYGWIPLEEFKKMKITTFFSLANHVNEEYSILRRSHEAVYVLAGGKKR